MCTCICYYELSLKSTRLTVGLLSDILMWPTDSCNTVIKFDTQ